jgi:hypothetical protein
MIHSTSNNSGYPRADALAHLAKQNTPSARAEVSNSEKLSRVQTDSLNSALANSPEVRPEVVERAKRLAVDPNYPPRQIIEQLAKLVIAAQDPAEQT